MRQREPGDESGALLVLGPGWAELLAPARDDTGELRGRTVQSARRARLQLALPDRNYLQTGSGARLPDDVSEELALSRVDQGMRAQDLSQIRQRPTGRQKNAAGHGLAAGGAQLGQQLAERALRERGGFVRRAANQGFGGRERPALGGMERLPRCPP